MANMSYCRFENTERALRDCYAAMYGTVDDMCSEEKTARENLFLLVQEMNQELATMPAAAREYGDPDIDVS